MSFLGLEGKTFLVCGVANRKSVAYHAGRLLAAEGAQVVYSVRSPERAEQVARLLPDSEIHVCDVERQDQIDALAAAVARRHPTLHGLLHSIAFARYDTTPRPFHETRREDLLQALDISCFSLVALCNALKQSFDVRASVVTVSISTTRMAAANYGYMAPVKAALDSTLVFLAKSFSQTSEVRFNAVCPGLLKTSASAGIPGYVESYLYAEQATLRRRALQTEEVANAIAFLLSERSSGITGQRLVLDAGMSLNYFDRELVRRAMRRP